MNKIFFQIPSTTANLGPGFDVLGIALNIYNYIQVEFDPHSNFEIYDFQNRLLPYANLNKNLIYISFLNVLNHYKIEEIPKWKAKVHMGISPGKGFGSSATAVVAGVQIAKEYLKNKGISILLEKEIEFFLQIENHPDNVVPARIGGWIFCHNPKMIIKKNLPEELGICALIPNYEISTKVSRAKLKEQYTREDAISNMKGCLLWLEYIHSQKVEYLKAALQLDRLHQPYRFQTIKYYKEIQNFIEEIKCIGMSLSGSGPGLIIYYDKNKQNFYEKEITNFIKKLNSKENKEIEYHIKFCNPDYDGLRILMDEEKIYQIIRENHISLINL